MSYWMKHQDKTHYSLNCLHEFRMKPTFDQHIELCYKQKTQAIKFLNKPEEKEVNFKNTKRQLPMHFIIYAYFEAYTTKTDEPQHVNTIMFSRHVPSGFGYMVLITDPQYTKPPVIYRGDNVVDTFLQLLGDKQREISNILSVEKPMIMTAEDVQRH